MKKKEPNRTLIKLRILLFGVFLIIFSIGIAFKVMEYNNNGKLVIRHSGSRSYDLDGNSIIVLSFIILISFLFILKKSKMK